MATSAVNLENVLHETYVTSQILVEVDDGMGNLTFTFPSSSSIVVWQLSGSDPTTNLPYTDTRATTLLTDAYTWFSNKNEQLAVGLLDSSLYDDVYLNTFGPQPSSNNPSVYLAITPYCSGGSSFQVYIPKESTGDPYTQSKRVKVTNQAELATIGNPQSGILSGYWTNGTGSITSFNLSGMVEYTTGHVWLDFHNIAVSTFNTKTSALYIKYEANYPAVYNTIGSYASAAKLNLFSKNDHNNYWMNVALTSIANTVSTDQGNQDFTFNSQHMYLIPLSYDTSHVELSAVYEQGSELSGFNTAILSAGTYVWPFDSVSGRVMAWKTESLGPVNELSAFLPQQGNVLVPFPLSGWSKSLEYVVLTSNSLQTNSYYISAYFPDEQLAARLPILSAYRVPAVYYFEYVSPYTQCSAIYLSTISFDNQPFVREWKIQVMDYTTGTPQIMHPSNMIKLNATNSSNVRIRNSVGQYFGFNSYFDPTEAYTLELRTSYFDEDTPPRLSSFLFRVSAYDTFHSPISVGATTQQTIVVDTFPSPNYFDVQLQANYEMASATPEMWRILNAGSYTLTAIEHLVLEPYTTGIVGGNLTATDGVALSTITPAIFTFTSVDDYTVSITRRDVTATGWLSAHAMTSEVDLHIISNFMDASFKAWPTYVFPTSSTMVVNTSTDPVTSNGVREYDVGHTGVFYLSALQNGADTYYWQVGDTVLYDDTQVVTYTTTDKTDLSGLPIYLKVYNADNPISMPETYLSDNDGSIQYYPNVAFTTTADGDPLFQNLRVTDLDLPVVTITPYTDNLILIPSVNVLSAQSVVVFPSASPVVENLSLSYWYLSTLKWTKSITTNNFYAEVTVGPTDTEVGVIRYGSTAPLRIVLNRKSYSHIPNVYPPLDWGTISEQDQLTYVDINYDAVPELLFSNPQQYILVDQPITFVNDIAWNYLLNYVVVDDGTGHMFTVSAGDTFTTSYSAEGTYSLSITGYSSYSDPYVNVIDSIVTVVSAFEIFDDDVSRIFGVTELVLPYSYEETRIPPNEWITSENFNRVMTRLNDNLDYLINMTKFYHLPPVDYLGWLGDVTVDGNPSFEWDYAYYANYQPPTEALSNLTLSGVKDFVSRNNLYYVLDSNRVLIYDTNTNPVLQNSIVRKAIDDYFTDLVAMDIDSYGRVYLLERSTNRVMVFENAYPNNFVVQWGGLGGPKAQQKFNNPNELVVDKNNNVWVVDTGNKAIKKYTRTGSWLQTIQSDMILGTTVEDNGLISIAFDREDNIHALTKTNVLKFSNTGIYLGSYTFDNASGQTPRRIGAMDGGGFLYIVLPDAVVKVLENGNKAGTFASDSTASYTSVYHDVYKNFYLTNTYTILKYFESNVVQTSLHSNATQNMWNVEDITVDKDENIQDWVCNIILKRSWDNIELFRRGLLGKIVFDTNEQGAITVSIINFTPEEYQALYPTPKADIFIGVNELVTADVINRCVAQLYDSLENLRTRI